MAVSMADITKLRKMTGAGMMDCKNALNDAEGDFDKAMEIIRKKGQAVAAKRQTVKLLKVAFWLRLPVTLPLSSL
mgnify:FL=1